MRDALARCRLWWQAAALIACALAAHPHTAFAACRCAYVDGEQQQLCDSTIDLPALCGVGMAPPAPLGLPPLAPMTLPPLGTTSCRMAQVWNGQEYVWQQVCS